MDEPFSCNTTGGPYQGLPTTPISFGSSIFTFRANSDLGNTLILSMDAALGFNGTLFGVDFKIGSGLGGTFQINQQGLTFDTDLETTADFSAEYKNEFGTSEFFSGSISISGDFFIISAGDVTGTYPVDNLDELRDDIDRAGLPVEVADAVATRLEDFGEALVTLEQDARTAFNTFVTKVFGFGGDFLDDPDAFNLADAIAVFQFDDNSNLGFLGHCNELANGLEGNDTMLGGLGDDTILGGEGADLLHDNGAVIDDTDPNSAPYYTSVALDFGWTPFVYDAEGDDTLMGEEGSDILVYSGGVDHFFGGTGDDTYLVVPEVLTNASADDELTIYLNEDAADSETWFGHDLISGTGEGVARVVFEGINSDEVTFNYNIEEEVVFTEMSAEFLALFPDLAGISGFDLGSYPVYSVTGSLEIIVNATGSSLYIENVSASYVGGANAPGGNIYVPPSFSSSFDLVFDDVTATDWANVIVPNGTTTLTSDVLSSTADVATESYQNETAGDEEDVVPPPVLGEEIGTETTDTITGTFLNELLQGLGGDDTIYGGSADDILEGGAGADSLDGGGGYDLASYANSSQGVVVDLAIGTASGGEANGDTFVSIEGVVGSEFSDTLTGGDYSNFLYGMGGADSLNGGDGVDVLYGGAGDDRVASGTDGSVDYLFGGTGNDDLFNNGGTGYLYGESGNDELFGYSGQDLMYGGTGDDILTVSAGDDLYDGGEGFDILTNEFSFSFLSTYIINLADGVAGNGSLSDTNVGIGTNQLVSIEGYIGGRETDIVTGSEDANLLAGGFGNDQLFGMGGADTLQGGVGDDLLEGGAGDDMLYGGAGDDEFHGGFGADTAVYEGAYADYSFSTTGDTLFITSAADGTDRVEADVETITFSDGTYSWSELSGIVVNQLPVASPDVVTVTEGQTVSFDPRMNDVDGNGDPLSIATIQGIAITTENTISVGNGISVQMDDNGVLQITADSDINGLSVGDTQVVELTYEVSDGFGGIDSETITITIEGVGLETADGTVSGTDGDDTIDTLYTGDPDGEAINNDGQTILAGAGDDLVYTGTGADSVSGGTGDDLIFENSGADTFDGGTGVDTLDTTYGNFNVTFDLGTGVLDYDNGGFVQTATNFENVATAGGNDTITGTDGANSIDAGSGSDTVYGGGGDDLIIAGFGADTFDGGTGNDTLDYSYLNNPGTSTVFDLALGTLVFDGVFTETATNFENAIGGIGSDTFIGTNADNVFQGNMGSDTFTLGAGADRVVFSDDDDSSYEESDDVDTITDFDIYEDQIELNGEVFDPTSVQEGVSVAQVGANVEITYDVDVVYGTEDVIVLENVDLGAWQSLIGPTGDGTITGTSGNDAIDGTFTGDPEGDVVTNNGDTIDGGAGNDLIYDGAGDDTVFGGDGADTFFAGDGADAYDGGESKHDGVDFRNATQGVVVDLTDATNNEGFAAGDTYTNIEKVVGSSHDDVLIGDDVVFKLIGGDGNDTIVSGARNNLLTGGNDLDTFVFNTGSGNDTIKDFDTSEGDLLDVSGWGAASLSDLTLDDSSGTLVVSLGADSVKLQGITSVSELTEADFVF